MPFGRPDVPAPKNAENFQAKRKIQLPADFDALQFKENEEYQLSQKAVDMYAYHNNIVYRQQVDAAIFDLTESRLTLAGGGLD